MNGNDIIKRLVSGEFYHSYRQVKYMVCDDNTLVVLADFRLDCGIIDKILREHTFKHSIWLSFCDNGTVIDEVPRTTGKVFKVIEYMYIPSSLNEEDVPFIKEAILNIKKGVLNDSHNNPESNSPTVRLKTTYRLTVEQNGVSKKVRGEWVNKEEAMGIGMRLYKNHNQEDYIVFLVTVLRFPQYDGSAREMSFPCKIENITESKTNKNMKKNVVKINENTLRKIVAESVKKVLEEDYYEDWKKKYETKQRKGFSTKDADSTVKMMARIAKNKKNNPYLNENHNQGIVDDAIQSICSIREKVSKAATQVGFNPEQGNDEVSKLIKQISTLMYRLDRTVNADYYDSFYSGQD